MALAAYRHLLRSIRLVFQGDERMLSAAISQSRAGFEAGRQLDPQSDEARLAVEQARDIAKALRENVVQGVSDQVEGTYRLRIHEETERGDNDSVKRGGNGTLSGVKCATPLREAPS